MSQQSQHPLDLVMTKLQQQLDAGNSTKINNAATDIMAAIISCITSHKLGKEDGIIALLYALRGLMGTVFPESDLASALAISFSTIHQGKPLLDAAIYKLGQEGVRTIDPDIIKTSMTRLRDETEDGNLKAKIDKLLLKLEEGRLPITHFLSKLKVTAEDHARERCADQSGNVIRVPIRRVG